MLATSESYHCIVASYTAEQVNYYSSKIPPEARLCSLPCCVDEDRVTCVAGLAASARRLVQCVSPEFSGLLVCEITL